jgi:type I restriction enzyme M protein
VQTILKVGGQAAIVVPDNVLFEGGAGELVRKRLMQNCDVHTLLRLPTGIFYAQGVKANVLFFEKKPASETAWTKKLWVYDLRTNMNFTLKTNPLKDADLEDFVTCYNEGNRFDRSEADRFRGFEYEALLARDRFSVRPTHDSRACWNPVNSAGT